MLSETELQNIFAWKPYREDWPLESLNDQTILSHFGALIKEMINNSIFECTQTQPGDITNYLEFLCYPPGVKDSVNDQSGILVCVSLCAPLAVLCETLFKKDKKSFVYAFPDPQHVGKVKHPGLKPVEKEIKVILEKFQLKLIPGGYANAVLPQHLADNLDSLNFGNRNLHGIFQWRTVP